MTKADTLFLSILSASLRGEAYDGPLDAAEAEELFHTAEIHSVLPLVVEAICRRAELRGSEQFKAAREKAVGQAVRQITQDNEFLNLLEKLQGAGYDPLVVKGLVCRALYPKPYLRPSVDEDILVPAADFAAYNRLLPELGGMFADHPDADLETAFETSFHKENSPLYVEVHRSLFEPDSEAYGDCNRPFIGAPDRAAETQAQDLTVRTLDPTDHLLYLILHAFKHFLYSGFGIRYVCDIALFAEHYDADIDWERVTAECGALRADRFAAAIFRIGESRLAIPMPEAWRGFDVDDGPMLEDILTGGLYGIADENRLHSSRITLSARAGTGGGVLRSLFPGTKYFMQHYPYVKKHPILLPAAWAQRVFTFLKRSGEKGGVSAAESIRIGQERVRLMEQYGIIGREDRSE